MGEGWPEPGPYFGREAVMREFEQFREAWDADAAEPISDFIDVPSLKLTHYPKTGSSEGPYARPTYQVPNMSANRPSAGISTER